MMMMSTPSSSFQDYWTIDRSLSKEKSLSSIQTYEEYSEESVDHINNNKNRNTIVKRPMNAFLLWARGERKRVSSDGGGVSQTSLSKLLGETWRHMSVEEKQPFLDMAEALKRQYHIDHPDYRIKPKQRSPTANKTIVKKHHPPTPFPLSAHSVERQLSNMISSSSSSSSASVADVNPHSIQPTVLAMCQAMIPISSSTTSNHEWFLKLIDQPQPVIVAPHPRTQISPASSRRAVRIQIINKHDDIALPPPTLLPMTPSPLSSSSIVLDESTPTLVDYLANSCTIFNIPHHQQGLAPVLEDTVGDETIPDSSNSIFMDLDQPYDGSSWIDTPLSNFGTNSADILSTSPYTIYDFLCL